MESTSTHEHYVIVCKQVDAMLLDHLVHAHLSESDVMNHFNSNWPVFKPSHHSFTQDQILWGMMDKSTDSPNEIYLNPDLVRELGAAQEICKT